MATLRDVKKRIRTVESTKRITKAMEMVAAANLRRAQQRVERTRPYSAKMDEMLSHLATGSTREITRPYFEQREVGKKTLVIVTSDRGLCGSYNSTVIRRATRWLEENSDTETELVTIGKKGNDHFERRPWNIVGYWGDWGGALDYDKAREVVNFLTERFISGESDEINMMFTQFLSTVRYNLTTELFLPVAPPVVEEGTTVHSEYIFEPSPESIYAALMPGYAMTKMVKALAESFASEHGSRMIAMGNATTNADEMGQALTLAYNKARQSQITTELLEVVSGAEALKG